MKSEPRDPGVEPFKGGLHVTADAVGLLDVNADGDLPPTWKLHPCPRCGSGLFRTERRFLDRVLHPVNPVHRYQCFARTCGWIGSLPAAVDERLASSPLPAR